MRILRNFDVSSYYPNTVRLFGYSSRNQKNKDAYVDILTMRMEAKHGKLDEKILKELDVTNKDVKDGLKLPINAYT